jgi:hypothetical protein
MQFNRPIQYMPVQSATMTSASTNTSGYMGFCHKQLGYDLGHLSLKLYLHPHHFAQFIDFLQQREVGPGSMQQHLAHARKVATFWTSTHPTDPLPHCQSLEAMINFLTLIEKQMLYSTPKEEDIILPAFADLQAWVLGLCKEALDAYELSKQDE